MEKFNGKIEKRKSTKRSVKSGKFTKTIGNTVITGSIVKGKGKVEKTYSPRNIDIGGMDLVGQVARKHTKNEYLDQYYRVNDTVSTCVDAVAFAAVGGGFHFAPYVEGEEINKNHRIILQRFFDDINTDDESEDLLTDTFMDMGTYGDAYWERVVSYRHLTSFIKYLKKPVGDPWAVKIPYKFYKVSAFNTSPKTKDGKFTGYVQVNDVGIEKASWKPDQIVHFRMPSPIDELRGLAPSATLNDTIAADLFANDYNGKFFENNATPRLHIDLGNVSSEELDLFIGKATKELKGKPHKNIVTRGGVKITPVGIKNADMEFSEYQKSLRQKIMARYRVQPAVVGYGEARNAKEAEAQIALFKFLGVEPSRRIVASRINKKILRPLFPYIKAKFIWNPVDALDLVIRSEVDSRDLEQNVRSINEVRAERGMKKAKWGKKPILMPGQKQPGDKPGNKKNQKEEEDE